MTERVKRSLAHALFLATASVTLIGCPGPQYPNCNTDNECHEGEFCVNGRCQQCRPNASDCPAGQRCTQGRCEAPEGFCTGTGDCPNGQECRNNRCVTTSVTTGGGDTGNGGAGGCTLSAVNFDYDSSELDPSTRNALEANARCIQERHIAHVQLVGHTDPRGTEEYNLALGERRARTVKSFLENLGVAGAGLGVSSMGEEMASGEDETGWARDRRVEFVER